MRMAKRGMYFFFHIKTYGKLIYVLRFSMFFVHKHKNMNELVFPTVQKMYISAFAIMGTTELYFRVYNIILMLSIQYIFYVYDRNGPPKRRCLSRLLERLHTWKSFSRQCDDLFRRYSAFISLPRFCFLYRFFFFQLPYSRVRRTFFTFPRATTL